MFKSKKLNLNSLKLDDTAPIELRTRTFLCQQDAKF
jgi:hypothetical protein